jgi:PAS domain S-box-containing protein
MEFNFNLFANTLLFSGTATFFLGLIIFFQLGRTVKWFGLVMLCIAVWSVTYAMELACLTKEDMLFWVNFEYIGIAFLPATWLVFTLKFSNLRKLITPATLVLIFIFPVITLITVWTDHNHHMHYQSVELLTNGPFPILRMEPGFWYHIHTVYFYFALALGNYFLFKNYITHNRLFRKQNRSIIIASFIPWMVNVLYLSGIRPYDGIDLTPYAFIVTSATIAFSFLRFKLFTIIPVAHEKVVESMHDGILIIDSNENIVDANKAIKEFLALKNEKVIGRKASYILKDHQQWMDRITYNTEGQFDILVNDKYLEVYSTRLQDPNSENYGLIFIARDITERKNAQDILQQQADQLKSLNGVKDKLFSIISHDLRSPLASLAELLNLAKTGNLTGQEFTTFISLVSDNVGYTSTLLENLLHWSRSQIKGEGINPQSFDIYEVVGKEVKYFTKNAADKKISIIDKTVPGNFVFADKDMIQLVVRNLISNAIKFCNPSDTITLSAITGQHYTTVSVIDTGVGMNKESTAKLFGADIFTTRGTQDEYGTGLGLMLCKDFVEKNGGTIRVDSELGKGSTFTFTLKSH